VPLSGLNENKKQMLFFLSAAFIVSIAASVLWQRRVKKEQVQTCEEKAARHTTERRYGKAVLVLCSLACLAIAIFSFMANGLEQWIKLVVAASSSLMAVLLFSFGIDGQKDVPDGVTQEKSEYSSSEEVDDDDDDEDMFGRTLGMQPLAGTDYMNTSITD